MSSDHWNFCSFIKEYSSNLRNRVSTNIHKSSSDNRSGGNLQLVRGGDQVGLSFWSREGSVVSVQEGVVDHSAFLASST